MERDKIGTYLFGKKIDECAVLHMLGYLTAEQWSDAIKNEDVDSPTVWALLMKVSEQWSGSLLTVVLYMLPGDYLLTVLRPEAPDRIELCGIEPCGGGIQCYNDNGENIKCPVCMCLICQRGKCPPSLKALKGVKA